MKIKTIGKEEIENISYDDLAYIILKEKDGKMKINDIFRIICDEKKLSESAFENQIEDFFTLLSTEKRFIQLANGYWDLRENHTSEISIKEIEEESEDEMIEEENSEDEKDEEVDYYDELDDNEDDKPDDDLKGLVVIDDSFEDDTEL